MPRKRGSLNRLLPAQDTAGEPTTPKMHIHNTPFARDSLVHQKSFGRSKNVESKQGATHDLERFLFTLPLKVDIAALRASIADGAKYEVCCRTSQCAGAMFDSCSLAVAPASAPPPVTVFGHWTPLYSHQEIIDSLIG